MSSYFSSVFTDGGVSYWSGFSSRSNPYTSSQRERPRFKDGSFKPEKNDSLWWQNRHYGDDETVAKNEGKKALSLDLLKEENRLAHKTDKYGVKNLIVRRGQEFKVKLETKVPFNKGKDRLQFIFMAGNFPQESKGTLVRVDVHNDKASSDNSKHSNWKGYIESINGQNIGSVLNVVIIPSADALVTRYTIQTNVFGADLNEERKKFSKNEEEKLYVLFNAWCKDDQVYVENEEGRFEYVLNETGRIWVGHVNRNYGKPWNFGQFSKSCLDGAMYLLEFSPPQMLGNATLVCRKLSAMANSNSDDKGVLTGRWSGKYSGGTSPTQWNGSQAIMQEYMLTKRAVKFGQCWVFSGLITTLCRALGIPSRSVTNFESAHDKDMSMTIDSHFDLYGKSLKSMNDSVWNFHVWNEAWFKRPDLPDGYDGWQAFDATPQELSEGVMQCGPAPVKAIKEGDVYLGYDTKFIFAEVNADRMTWYVLSSGDMFTLSDKTETDSVGKNISTKSVGSGHRHDLTLNYKYAEGSEEERKAVKKALRFSSRKENLSYKYKQLKEDVKFTYNGETKPNADVSIKVNVENTSNKNRSVKLTVSLNAAYYTGITAEELSSETLELNLKPGEKKDQSWTVKAESYLNIIDEDAKLKLFIAANVKETKQVFTKEDMFEIEKPELKIQASNKKPKVGESFEVTLAFTNPVGVKLTEGVFRLEGPGIQKNMKIPIHRSVASNEAVTEKIKLTPRYQGKREIIACFHSRQLTGISGVTEVEVV